MEAKHTASSFTPGPWHSKPGDVSGFKTSSGLPGVYAQARASDDFFILKIAELDTNVPYHEVAANARLIAAAPELLAALTKCRGLLRDYAWAGGDLHQVDVDALHAADAAITKATGDA